jgi:hypothetical protein
VQNIPWQQVGNLLDDLWSAVKGALGPALSWEQSLSITVPIASVTLQATILDTQQALPVPISFPDVMVDLPVPVPGCSAMLTVSTSAPCERRCVGFAVGGKSHTF